jgi:hypothetical protein
VDIEAKLVALAEASLVEAYSIADLGCDIDNGRAAFV